MLILKTVSREKRGNRAYVERGYERKERKRVMVRSTDEVCNVCAQAQKLDKKSSEQPLSIGELSVSEACSA